MRCQNNCQLVPVWIYSKYQRLCKRGLVSYVSLYIIGKPKKKETKNQKVIFLRTRHMTKYSLIVGKEKQVLLITDNNKIYILHNNTLWLTEPLPG